MCAGSGRAGPGRAGGASRPARAAARSLAGPAGGAGRSRGRPNRGCRGAERVGWAPPSSGRVEGVPPVRPPVGPGPAAGPRLLRLPGRPLRSRAGSRAVRAAARRPGPAASPGSSPQPLGRARSPAPAGHREGPAGAVPPGDSPWGGVRAAEATATAWGEASPCPRPHVGPGVGRQSPAMGQDRPASPSAPGASPLPRQNPSGARGARAGVGVRWLPAAGRCPLPLCTIRGADALHTPDISASVGRSSASALRCTQGDGGHLLGSGLFVDPRPGAQPRLPVRMEGTIPPGCSSPGIPGQR